LWRPCPRTPLPCHIWHSDIQFYGPVVTASGCPRSARSTATFHMLRKTLEVTGAVPYCVGCVRWRVRLCCVPCMWCCDRHNRICPDLAVFVNLWAVFLVPSCFGLLLGCHILPVTVRHLVRLPLLTRQRRGLCRHYSAWWSMYFPQHGGMYFLCISYVDVFHKYKPADGTVCCISVESYWWFTLSAT